MSDKISQIQKQASKPRYFPLNIKAQKNKAAIITNTTMLKFIFLKYIYQVHFITRYFSYSLLYGESLYLCCFY